MFGLNSRTKEVRALKIFSVSIFSQFSPLFPTRTNYVLVLHQARIFGHIIENAFLLK